LLFVLFYVLFVCKCVLPPGDNPIAVNKHIVSKMETMLLLTTTMIMSDLSKNFWLIET
jgi:hypothetical protein